MMQNLPLSGIRIIEPGQVWALPYAINPLAAYGAEVIKVESTIRPVSYTHLTLPTKAKV